MWLVRPQSCIVSIPKKSRRQPIGNVKLRGWEAQQHSPAIAPTTMTKKADESDTVVIGTVPIFDHLAFALFDSSSMHSLISKR